MPVHQIGELLQLGAGRVDPHPGAAVLLDVAVRDGGMAASLGQDSQRRVEVPAHEVRDDVHAVGPRGAHPSAAAIWMPRDPTPPAPP